MTTSFVSDVCVHQVLLVNCNITNATYIWADFRGCASYSGAGSLRVKHQVTYIQGHPLKLCAWLDFLFTIFVCTLLHREHSHKEVIPSFLLCLHAKSKLCCTNFSYH